MRDLIDIPSTIALLERYDRPGLRYTSYPTAVEFHDDVGLRCRRTTCCGAT